ncbi:tetratricopeptide repeat protein [Thermodesulfobacteriota bacterium]
MINRYFRWKGKQALQTGMAAFGTPAGRERGLESLRSAEQMFRRIQDRSGLISLGNFYFNNRMYDEALRIFSASGHGDGLVRMAEHCIDIGDLRGAEKFYRRAERPLDGGEYKAIAEKLLSAGFLSAAAIAFEKAGDLESLDVVAARFIEKGDVGAAGVVLNKAGREIDEAELEGMADRFISQGMIAGADQALKKIGKSLDKVRLKELGDRLLAEGKLTQAETAYRRADDSDGLTRLVDGFLDKGCIEAAFRLSGEIGCEIPSEKVRSIGERCLDDGMLGNAAAAFERIGDQRGLAEVARRYLETGAVREVVKIQKMADRTASDEEMVRLGEDFLGKGRIHGAEAAFRAAGHDSGLADVGRRHLDQGNVFSGLQLMWKTGRQPRKEELQQTADRYAKEGRIQAAQAAYMASDRKIGEEEFRKFGDFYLDNSMLASAERAFRLGNITDGLEKVGDQYLEEGDFFSSDRAYREAGRQISKEDYQRIAEGLLDRGIPSAAQWAFEQAEDVPDVESYRSIAGRFRARGHLYGIEWALIKAGDTAGLEEMARAYEEMGDVWSVERVLQAAGSPLDSARYGSMGREFLAKGYLNAALYAFDRAGDTGGFVEVGDAYLAKGDLYMAERAYEKGGRKLERSDYSSIAGDFMGRELFLEAEKALDEAGEARAWITLGEVYLDRGLLCDAERAFGKGGRPMGGMAKLVYRIKRSLKGQRVEMIPVVV